MLSTCRGAYLAEDLQPAMSSDIRGASQAAADMQQPYRDLKVVSFNFGMHSRALKSKKEKGNMRFNWL